MGRSVPISVQLALARQDVKERESSDGSRSWSDDSYSPRRRQRSTTMSTLDLRCLMAEPNSGIGNVTTNTGLVEMAIAYSRSRVLCAAARLGVADALADEVRSVGFLAEKCQADANRSEEHTSELQSL